MRINNIVVELDAKVVIDLVVLAVPLTDIILLF